MKTYMNIGILLVAAGLSGCMQIEMAGKAASAAAAAASAKTAAPAPTYNFAASMNTTCDTGGSSPFCDSSHDGLYSIRYRVLSGACDSVKNLQTGAVLYSGSVAASCDGAKGGSCNGVADPAKILVDSKSASFSGLTAGSYCLISFHDNANADDGKGNVVFSDNAKIDADELVCGMDLTIDDKWDTSQAVVFDESGNCSAVAYSE